MLNEFIIDGTMTIPISIRQEDEPNLYRSLRKWGPLSKWNWFLATQEVLQLILIGRTAVDPEKQTVWHFWKRYGQETSPRNFHAKIGTGFSNISFANKCFALSEKRAQEIIYTQFVCSCQSPTFNNDQSGFSIRLTFELIPMGGKARIINCVSGIAGLNKWENLALILGLNYRLGLIKPYDSQFQNILEIANRSVENKSADLYTEDISIGQYVRNLFYLINRELPPRIV